MATAIETPVPLCDILGQYHTQQADIEAAVLRVMRSGQAILGPEVLAFEKEAAEYCGAPHALGCGSGTDALSLALHALDVGPGDEVILPPFTFFATVGSIMRTGATPVFADIEPGTFNIDPVQVERKISARTKVIMPVHLYGQCANMEPIWRMAQDKNIAIVEDAAQSFGACYERRRCGTLGVISCFSFYPSKNLGTLGDAGLVTTIDERLHKKMLALRNHGSEVKYFHKYLGWNARLDALHAAILRVKLPRIETWIDGRRQAARRYDSLIPNSPLSAFMQRPTVMPHGRHTFNQYVVRVPAEHRDALVKHLKAANVGCEVYYPLSLHLQECAAHLGYKLGDFPVSEQASQEVIALPIFPEITEAQQQRVVDVCSAFVQTASRTKAA